MTSEQRIVGFAQAVGADVKEIRARVGLLASLTTIDKTSIVNALNEIKSLIAIASAINDLAASSSTTYSSNKIISLISTAKSEILGGASGAYDTLLEIQNLLQGDGTAISGLLTAVSKRVAFDQAQSLTSAEKLQACNNIGIGDPDYNFVLAYTTVRDAI